MMSESHNVRIPVSARILGRAVPASGAALLLIYAVLALVAPLIFHASWISLLYLTLYFISLAAAWNFFSGFSGYINFGYVAFIGIGMYAGVIAYVDLKISVIASFIFGGLASALFAALIGYPILRIRGAYFSIAMLAIAEGARVLAGTEYLEPFTRGGSGIAVLAGDLVLQYYAMLALTAAVVASSMLMARSRFGLSLIGAREDEAAADGMGVNTTIVKLTAFIISAFFAGTAGAIHATFLHYIEPFAAFDIKYTMLPIIMAIFGGLGTVVGPVIGGLFLELVSDYAWLHFGRMNVTLFGLVLMGLVLWMPDGVIVRLKELGLLPKSRMI
ncbi:MAG TPA: branched-chain amino acid ABC transporter permease [Xanthobacteraceae bacterium]